MRTFILVSKNLGIFGDRGATIESADTDVGHVLRKASVLIFYLKSEFTGMAKDDDRDFAIGGLQLLECCKDEDRSLAMPRLGLAKNVHAQHGLRDALLLDFTCKMSVMDMKQAREPPSEGCSKPRSLMARKSSGFNKKSLDDV